MVYGYLGWALGGYKKKKGGENLVFLQLRIIGYRHPLNLPISMSENLNRLKGELCFPFPFWSIPAPRGLGVLVWVEQNVRIVPEPK